MSTAISTCARCGRSLRRWVEVEVRDAAPLTYGRTCFKRLGEKPRRRKVKAEPAQGWTQLGLSL